MFFAIETIVYAMAGKKDKKNRASVTLPGFMVICYLLLLWALLD
jgi:hypothetical protein